MTEVHYQDWGTLHVIACKEGKLAVDLTDATEIQIRYQDGDGIVFPVDTGDGVTKLNPPGSDGKIYYTFPEGFVALVGIMNYQTVVTFPTGMWHSDILEFDVAANIEIPSPSPSPS